MAMTAPSAKVGVTTEMAAVRHRFSQADAAGRWNAMYAAETENLEDANFRQRRDFTVARVLELAGPDPAACRVLDLGCGTGPVLAELRRHGVPAQGLDYSEDMLAHARNRLRAMDLDDGQLDRHLVQGDCRYTAYPAASFDVVVCLGVISYIEDYRPVLAEIYRLLKPGGTAIISFRSAFNPLCSDPVALARRGLRLLLTPLLGPRQEPPFEIGRFLDHRQVTARIEALGFVPAGFTGIGFGPFRLAGRRLFSERQSIRISQGLDRLCTALGWQAPRRWLADVSLWIHRKPGPAAPPHSLERN